MEGWQTLRRRPSSSCSSSDEAGEIRTFFRQQSDHDGSFNINGIGPGIYTLLAIDDGRDLDWQQESVLSRYLPAAVTVQIPDTTDKIQTLTEPLIVQPR